ncbi:MAG: helix-turn-helix transcriptional regulator [Clostridia bacterium]|nr:helix-turn-helix transcriptional regulator [Clostridia bacterium]
MKIKVLREPILLFETVAMICRYFRGESYAATAERLEGSFGEVLKPSQRSELRSNGAIAESLMNSICADIDKQNEDFKFFFTPFETGADIERNCVAKVLIFSMLTLNPMSLDDAFGKTKQGWDYVKRTGMEILHFHMHGINFIHANGRPLPSLFEQIYAMNYPHKAKMDSFLAIDSHELYLDKLHALIKPYAERLEREWGRLLPIYASSADFWEMCFSVMSPEQAAELMRIEGSVRLKKLKKAYISLFLFNEVGNNFDDVLASTPEDITALYIGMGIYPEYTLVLADQRIERISEELKALSDPIRLEILMRLSKEPDYCLNLAQSMEMNAGNVSRYLTHLYERGFLIKTKERGRLYFKTDIDAIARTTANLLSILRDE